MLIRLVLTVTLVSGAATAATAGPLSKAVTTAAASAAAQATPRRPSSVTPVLWTLVAVRSADTATSLAVFADGGHEKNPLIISEQPAIFLAQMAGRTAFDWWLIRRLERYNPTVAKIVGWMNVGASGFAVGWNVRQLAR